MSDTVLDVRNLRVGFQTEQAQTLAVDNISFELKRGQTLGIVGESGSGKSVTSLAVMGLVPTPGKITGGQIWFRGKEDEAATDLLSLSPEQRRLYRGGQIGMIFQEPMTSLNPVYTCGFQLVEAIRQHQNVSVQQAQRQALYHLQEVKLLPSDEELTQRYLEEFHQKNPEQSIPGQVQINDQINSQKMAMLDRYPHQLSGGQLQRMMIAMAISCNPTVLIADEPTTALDVTVQATILDLLRELRDRRDMSMLFITHDLGIIAEIADSVAVMYRGKIVEYGSVRQIFSSPEHPYTKGLLTCRPRLDRRLRRLPTVSDFMEVVTTAGGDIEIREKLAQQPAVESSSNGLVGSPIVSRLSETQVPLASPSSEENPESEFPTSDIEHQTPESSTDSEHFLGIEDEIESDPWLEEPNFVPLSETVSEAEIEQRLVQLQQQSPLLSVQNLKVGFPARGMFGKVQRYMMAVNDVSFDVYPGETLGLVGESGCGKSTLARTLLRLIEPMHGSIKFDGREITNLAKQQLVQLRREMQIVFQNPFSSLDPRMKIGEAVMEPLVIHRVAKSSKQNRDRVAYLLERVGLNPDWIYRYPHQLSGGQRQRVCIARALALNPRFIICDESVSALDVSVQAQVLNLLKELQGEFKLTYIFISHDLSVVKFMSDRILVMNKGKIEEIGPAERIYREPQQEYTRQLIASIPTGNPERVRQRPLADKAVSY